MPGQSFLTNFQDSYNLKNFNLDSGELTIEPSTSFDRCWRIRNSGSIAQTMLSGQNHEEKPARQGFAVVSS
jgi:hypothetical protein